MIIWIASYPKSGNTWIRSLLSAYLFSKDGKFNFDLLKNISQFSSNKSSFNSNDVLKNQSSIFENWIPAQVIINKDKKIRLFKTHNAICTINGNKFTDKFNTKAAIYIVRDPRNVITSLSHHYSLNLDEAFHFLTNKRKIIFDDKAKKNQQDIHFLSDWSGHYKSWKNIGFCPVKIIKYEDILTDTYSVFISILEFLSKSTKLTIDEKKVNQSINTTSFKMLKQMEEKHGFVESIASDKTKKKVKFFNLGKKNDWKKLLSHEIIKKINETFKSEMNELNYL